MEEPRDKRVPVNFSVRLGYASVSEFLERQPKEKRGLDLSRTGMFVRTEKPMPVGTEVTFTLQLKDGKKMISGRGMVRWVAVPGTPDAVKRGPGLGIAFTEMDDDSRGLIHTVVAAREEYKKGRLSEGYVDPTSSIEPPPSIAALPLPPQPPPPPPEEPLDARPAQERVAVPMQPSSLEGLTALFQPSPPGAGLPPVSSLPLPALQPPPSPVEDDEVLDAEPPVETPPPPPPPVSDAAVTLPHAVVVKSSPGLWRVGLGVGALLVAVSVGILVKRTKPAPAAVLPKAAPVAAPTPLVVPTPPRVAVLPPASPAPAPAPAPSAPPLPPPGGLKVGGLHFEGLPAGAKVTLDTYPVPNPAADQYMLAGPHDIVVEANGFLPFETHVDLAIGELRALPVELKPRPVVPHGTVELNCQPWCAISVDGKDTGKTSPTKLSLVVGTHVLTLVNPPAGLAKKVTVKVTENGAIRQLVKLEE